ncbi:MAG: M20/M25/M40 family metallo-hydrolase [Oscillospiraceae bacterium]|nr:M20/M25/M40 family metallo-hydrolase [Oscillospiraceae bacterium]
MIFSILEKLCIPDGVSGDEASAAQAVAALSREYGKVTVTPLGSVAVTVREPDPGQPHILLDAHLDEIGLIVTAITPEGFLRFSSVGGIDPCLLPSRRVRVLGKEPVYGVITSVPPHLAKGDDEKKAPKMSNLFIDIGMDEASAKELITPGDRAIFSADPVMLGEDRVTSRALDDRACAAILLRTLALVKDQPLPCGLTVLFSSQEETGGAGAGTAAFAFHPDYAIITDVSFAMGAGCRPEDCGELGKGPMIGYAPILCRGIYDRLCALAEERSIPFQREIMSRSTGTNADEFATSRGGIKTGLLSLPLRYMHSPTEVVEISDIEASAQLLAAYLAGGIYEL